MIILDIKQYLKGFYNNNNIVYLVGNIRNVSILHININPIKSLGPCTKGISKFLLNIQLLILSQVTQNVKASNAKLLYSTFTSYVIWV